MDYEILNTVVSEIVSIVNLYNKRHGYDVSLCERMVLALLGYYLVFGPEIFEKIDLILDSLLIYQCETENELENVLLKYRPFIKEYTTNPGTIWDFKYHNNKFIGAIPVIFYLKDNLIINTFSLAHEISHVIEGLSAEVVNETKDTFELNIGFSDSVVYKSDSLMKIEKQGMTELITITIENKMLNEFLKLDVDKINNCLVKEFLEQLKKYKNKNIMLDSYTVMAFMFKDFIGNDYIFELIKKYYYENQREFFIEEYNSLNENLNFEKLIKYAEKVFREEVDPFYFMGIVQNELDILNRATGVETDKRILLFV